MQNPVTEKDYPVESSWILKIPVSFSIVTVFICIFMGVILLPISFTTSEGGLVFLITIGIILVTMISIGLLSTVIAFLSRDNFHYSVENEFVIFHQGILSKQQKNLPYGVIQDVIVNQDIADRLFGLASLIIENASFGGGQVYGRKQAAALIGFVGNVAVIPGLTVENAEKLKGIFLSKMREFTNADDRGGL